MESANKSAVLDTCCLINLCASGRIAEIIGSVFADTVVPRQVAAEGLYIKRPSTDDPEFWVSEEVSVQKLVDSRVLRITDFEQTEEVERFVRLATLVDDGEAACLAIASWRGYCLATDDRKAIRIARTLEVEVVTTPQILMRWDEVADPGPEELSGIIAAIEVHGRFRPHPTADHFHWWCEQRRRY